ncbi:MAG: arginine--tRNA ligase [Bdellovibrionales bacterium]|nr:arginine--tRNA ligase [Bdellovibrionales bacterium]
MKALQDPFRLQVAEQIAQQIAQSFQLKMTAEQCLTDFASVPNIDMGHLAFPCFKLAKELKSNPKEVAEKLSAEWSHDSVEVKALGPYLNFFFTGPFFGKGLVEPMIEGTYFKNKKSTDAPFLIEYSQPNTHKELHVGHMRNLCFGHSLILLFEYCGNPVISCTFPGDVGTHVAKCLWYLKYHNQEPVPTKHKGEWLGHMYSTAHIKLEDEKGTPQEEKNREQLTEILKQIEKKDGEFFELWKETREWSIELMNEVYDWAGVHFDRWYWESDVDSDSVKLVKKLYEEGKLIEDQGAIGLNLEDEKLGFCLFLKSDGNGLYATKDLELARRKFEEFNPQENIVVVDMRQELHFKQVFAAFGKLGLGDPKKCHHLKYNFVELPDGAMSSRKGNIIPITELIESMKATIKDEYLNRYEGEWSKEEIEKTADDVAQGAIKYGMNVMDPNKKIVFDMKEWLRLDGESGPYVQYAHARICSLLNKFGDSIANPPDWSKLEHKSEKELLVHLSLFNWSMHTSLKGYKTSGICNYVYDLAKFFNGFYQNCPIGKIDDEGLKAARMALAGATKAALEQGLALLGIPAPSKM